MSTMMKMNRSTSRSLVAATSTASPTRSSSGSQPSHAVGGSNSNNTTSTTTDISSCVNEMNATTTTAAAASAAAAPNQGQEQKQRRLHGSNDDSNDGTISTTMKKKEALSVWQKRFVKVSQVMSSSSHFEDCDEGTKSKKTTRTTMGDHRHQQQPNTSSSSAAAATTCSIINTKTNNDRRHEKEEEHQQHKHKHKQQQQLDATITASTTTTHATTTIAAAAVAAASNNRRDLMVRQCSEITMSDWSSTGTEGEGGSEFGLSSSSPSQQEYKHHHHHHHNNHNNRSLVGGSTSPAASAHASAPATMKAVMGRNSTLHLQHRSGRWTSMSQLPPTTTATATPLSQRQQRRCAAGRRRDDTGRSFDSIEEDDWLLSEEEEDLDDDPDDDTEREDDYEPKHNEDHHHVEAISSKAATSSTAAAHPYSTFCEDDDEVSLDVDIISVDTLGTAPLPPPPTTTTAAAASPQRFLELHLSLKPPLRNVSSHDDNDYAGDADDDDDDDDDDEDGTRYIHRHKDIRITTASGHSSHSSYFGQVSSSNSTSGNEDVDDEEDEQAATTTATAPTSKNYKKFNLSSPNLRWTATTTARRRPSPLPRPSPPPRLRSQGLLQRPDSRLDDRFTRFNSMPDHFSDDDDDGDDDDDVDVHHEKEETEGLNDNKDDETEDDDEDDEESSIHSIPTTERSIQQERHGSLVLDDVIAQATRHSRWDGSGSGSCNEVLIDKMSSLLGLSSRGNNSNGGGGCGGGSDSSFFFDASITSIGDCPIRVPPRKLSPYPHAAVVLDQEQLVMFANVTTAAAVTAATNTNIITKSNDRFTTNSMPDHHSALQIPERKVSLCPTSSHDAGGSDETSSTTATRTTVDRPLLLDSEKTELELEVSASAPVSKLIPATPQRTGSRFLLADQLDEGEDDGSSSFRSDGVNPFQKSSSPRAVTVDIMTNPHHQPRRFALMKNCNMTTAAVAAEKHGGDDDDDDTCDEYLRLSS